MKLIIWLLLVLIIPAVIAQVVPKDIDTTVVQKIDQEHKNTRKFFSDEMTRQRQEYFKSIDDRANYYETTANHLLTTAVLKLGLLWAGIVIFVVGITQFTRLRLEKNRFEKMLKTIRHEIANTQLAQNITNTQRTEAVPQETNLYNNITNMQEPSTYRQDLNVVGDRLQMPQKKSWSERRREQKMRKQILKLEKEKQKLQQREFKLVGNIHSPPPPPPPPTIPSPPPAEDKPTEQKKSDTSYDFEVKY